jgi:hypothetical protein
MGREEFIDFCNRNERRGMAWWRLGIWKLRGSRKGVEKRNMSSMFREGRYQTHFTRVSGNQRLENGNAV